MSITDLTDWKFWSSCIYNCRHYRYRILSKITLSSSMIPGDMVGVLLLHPVRDDDILDVFAFSLLLNKEMNLISQKR